MCCLPLWAEKKAVEVAVYLHHLPCQRLGEESDEACMARLQQQGFMVIPLDCSQFPPTSPELETALVRWHSRLKHTLSTYDTDSTTGDFNSIYYIPEGYAFDRVAVWNIAQHGAEGSMDYILNTWNKYIVPRFCRDSAFAYTDMVDKYGQALDYNLYVDIIYPSGHATQSVPLLLTFAGNSPRQNPYRPNQALPKVYTAIFQLGFLTTGYAYAIMDHCYNPLARNDVWKYFDDYTLDHWNGLASNSACVRYLKSHLCQYNLNGKIGCMGLSKASYAPMRLADPNNAKAQECLLFNGKSNTKPQPWQGASSTVDVVYSAAGNGSERLPDYFHAGCVPIITSAGLSDEYDQWDKYPAVVSHLNKIDHNFLSFWMEDMGHVYPGLGTDLRTGESRYVLFKQFFDRYLQPTDTDTTAVLYILPRDGATDVSVRGESRVLPNDHLLPYNMRGISAYEPITVRYLYDVDTTHLNQTIQVLDSRHRPVAGTWTKSMQGTCLSFTPHHLLIPGATYTIQVDKIKHQFTISNQK